ncbi:MAG: PIN domain nuclease, partial [Gemmatimonadaceae bacterium]|nr:PIN domain nuclease [Acetobacteraceae bacterium]
MRLLLDTHVLMWVLDEAYRIGPDLTLLLEDPNTEVMVRAVSVWEIAIKCALGRGDFRHRPEAIAAAARSMGF